MGLESLKFSMTSILAVKMDKPLSLTQFNYTVEIWHS
jgi:hypothetical protein